MRLAAALLLTLAACDDPLTEVSIEDARTFRQGAAVVVELDLRGSEGGGGNVGQYCLRVTFPFQPMQERCFMDLEDGDTKTVRFETTTAVAPGAVIPVAVRHNRGEARRNVVAP